MFLMMRLGTSPMPTGLTPGFLSKGINLYAVKASRCLAVLHGMYWGTDAPPPKKQKIWNPPSPKFLSPPSQSWN